MGRDIHKFKPGDVVNIPAFAEVGFPTNCLIVYRAFVDGMRPDSLQSHELYYYIMPLGICFDDVDLSNYNNAAQGFTKDFEQVRCKGIKVCDLRVYRYLYGYLETGREIYLPNLDIEEKKIVYYDARESFTIQKSFPRNAIVRVYETIMSDIATARET